MRATNFGHQRKEKTKIKEGDVKSHSATHSHVYRRDEIQHKFFHRYRWRKKYYDEHSHIL